MLGKRPCILRSTSSRSLLIPCEDMEDESATFCDYGQVTDPCPTISAPCKIVIGFEIGAEKKSPDICESPRSVLDTLALLPSQEKQQVVTKSPRAGLGSLLAANSGGGVGIGIEAQIQDKEAGVHMGSVAGSFKTAVYSEILLREAYPDKASLSMKLCHGHCKDTGKVSISDLMESDITSWQSQVSCVLCVEDECLDTDISPLRSQALLAPPSHDTAAHCTKTNISAYQRRVLDACRRNGSKDGCLVADIPPLGVHDPCCLALPYISLRNATNNEPSGVSYSPGSRDAVDGCKNVHISSWQSEDECTDVCISPWKTQALQPVSLDVECEMIRIQQSIFSATSPPSQPCSLAASTSSFLKVCAYCGCSLRLGKDIFMYSGDQAFCSVECRYQKIALDESKEKQGS